MKPNRVAEFAMSNWKDITELKNKMNVFLCDWKYKRVYTVTGLMWRTHKYCIVKLINNTCKAS